MATPKYTALATLTLSSAASTVTFGSIPAGYRDLYLVSAFSFSTGATVFYRFNTDSGSNYNTVGMSGAQSQARSLSSANRVDVNVSLYVGVSANEQVNGLLEVLDYSATDKHKSALHRMNQSGEVTATAARWANTAAINTVTVHASAGVFNIGSTFDLFGVK